MKSSFEVERPCISFQLIHTFLCTRGGGCFAILKHFRCLVFGLPCRSQLLFAFQISHQQISQFNTPNAEPNAIQLNVIASLGSKLISKTRLFKTSYLFRPRPFQNDGRIQQQQQTYSKLTKKGEEERVSQDKRSLELEEQLDSHAQFSVKGERCVRIYSYSSSSCYIWMLCLHVFLQKS